jgi:hypothetical protein
MKIAADLKLGDAVSETEKNGRVSVSMEIVIYVIIKFVRLLD